MKRATLQAVTAQVEAYLQKEGVLAKKAGLLVALSGGADSVLLTLALRALSGVHGFLLEAVHVNHGIRGEDAMADESFCAAFCKENGISMHLVREDVPALAKANGMGIEEAAREVRYRAFDRLLLENPRLCYVAVAHNATDNVETVLFHMARGCGLSGVCGIPEKRDRILRPLLAVDKATVLEVLSEQQIAYMEDKTNRDTVYRRNLIRHAVLPHLRQINPSLEERVSTMCAHLREDLSFIEQSAQAWYRQHADQSSVSLSAFSELPKALARRVAVLLYTQAGGKEMLESVHTDALLSSLETGKQSFIHRFPGGIFVYAQQGRLVFSTTPKKEKRMPAMQEIFIGENFLEGRDAVLMLTKNPHYLQQSPSNVYKIAIKANIASATIKGRLYVRARAEGDAYRYGGMSHSVKKLFAQKRLKGIAKEKIPVLCDESGILWVPGFSAREDAESTENHTLFAYYGYFGGENE